MSEIDEKEIKRRFEVISQFEPSFEVAARDVELVKKRFAEQTSRQQTREQKIWRIIMENRITKLTATALIIIVVILAISLWDKSTPTAYAIEQTIEAMRKVTTAHCLGTTFDGGQIEMWITVNPETGENEQYYLDSLELKMVASPNEAYTYDKKANVVNHLKGGNYISSDIRFGRFIEDMVEVTRSINSKVEIDYVYDTDMI